MIKLLVIYFNIYVLQKHNILSSVSEVSELIANKVAFVTLASFILATLVSLGSYLLHIVGDISNNLICFSFIKYFHIS